MSATFERLVGKRSVQVQEVRAYLLQLAEALDATHWRRGGEPIKASAIFVEPLVLTKRKRMRPPRPERYGVEAVAAPQSPIDELEAPQYELPLHREERQEERWQQVIRRGRARLALLGAPGGGKTFLTRHTIAELARQSAAKLDKQKATLDTIEVPIWVTAKALAEASGRALGDALLEALGNNVLSPATLTPHVRDWLQRAMASPRAVVVVDALDELEEGDRVGFQAKARLLEGLGGRVIVTCRTIPWEERQHWLGWRQMIEVELAPMQVRQQRAFVGRFFTNHPVLAHRMERLLQTNFALRHACTSPLLLTFACLLHEEGKVHEGTTHALLYAHMVRKMMSGEWRGVRPPWVGSTVLEERCVYWLEGIAWGLFAKAPHLNRFTLHDWEQVAEGHGKTPYAPAEFLVAIEQVGFVVPAGFDTRGDRCWSMVHRTFLEFLAARALSRLDRRIWLGEAKKHFWFQVEWLEVLTFLAGLVNDATPLIEAIEEEQDDLFGSMLYLKARLTGASANVDEAVVRRVCNEVLSFWRGILHGWRDSLREFALPMLAALAANAPARAILVEGVLEWTRAAVSDVRGTAVEALGYIGTEQAVEWLLELRQDEDYKVRWAAVEALSRMGTKRALLGLLAFEADPAFLVRQRILWIKLMALAAEWPPEWTRDADLKVSWVSTEALECIGVEEVALLLELTRAENSGGRRVAARALGRIGAKRAVARLLELTRDEDSGVRWAAAQALGRIGAKRAVARLLELTWDEDSGVHWAAAQALWQVAWKHKRPIRAHNRQEQV